MWPSDYHLGMHSFITSFTILFSYFVPYLYLIEKFHCVLFRLRLSNCMLHTILILQSGLIAASVALSFLPLLVQWYSSAVVPEPKIKINLFNKWPFHFKPFHQNYHRFPFAKYMYSFHYTCQRKSWGWCVNQYDCLTFACFTSSSAKSTIFFLKCAILLVLKSVNSTKRQTF